MTIYKIDWKKVATAANVALGKKYTGTYCKMVYMRKETSGKLLKQIKIILDSVDVKNG